MKRILLVLTVALIVAAMVVATAAPSFGDNPFNDNPPDFKTKQGSGKWDPPNK